MIRKAVHGDVLQAAQALEEVKAHMLITVLINGIRNIK